MMRAPGDGTAATALLPLPIDAATWDPNGYDHALLSRPHLVTFADRAFVAVLGSRGWTRVYLGQSCAGLTSVDVAAGADTLGTSTAYATATGDLNPFALVNFSFHRVYLWDRRAHKLFSVTAPDIVAAADAAQLDNSTTAVHSGTCIGPVGGNTDKFVDIVDMRWDALRGVMLFVDAGARVVWETTPGLPHTVAATPYVGVENAPLVDSPSYDPHTKRQSIILAHPVAVDPAGDGYVYILDRGLAPNRNGAAPVTARIVQVNPATGTATVFVGNFPSGSSEKRMPTSLAVDAQAGVALVGFATDADDYM